jgi:RNA polymerase sigma-70 factor (ECF subfamily)
MRLSEAWDSILQAAQEGADWAWSRVYDEYSGPLVGYLAMRGARDAENLVGEVFLQIARNIGGFSGTESNFRSWVFMVGHNRLIDERRRHSRRPEQLVDRNDLAHYAEPTDVEGQVLARISDEELVTLFEELTEDQRDVLVMRIMSGMSLEETAQALDKKIGAVSQLQRRALAALRKRIERGGIPR